jgi:hypothetical protein
MIIYIKYRYQNDTVFKQRYQDIEFSSEIIDGSKIITNDLRPSERRITSSGIGILILWNVTKLEIVTK